MPPKDILKDLNIGRGQVFVKPYDGGQFRELGEVVNDAITITEEEPTPECINATGAIAFSFHCEVSPEWDKLIDAIDRIVYAYKHRRKHRKTTYKTIRHDYAKRNGRR